MDGASEIDLKSLKEGISFNVKKEIYLYKTAETLLINGMGDRDKLLKYMEERLAIIEKLISLNRPFKICEGDKILLEVS